MNLEQVSHYIAHPHELGPNDAPALKEMSEKHPYAAVFSLLYLTALANGKSVDLDDALQQHAYRLSDRTKLYHLVNGSVGETIENTASSATQAEERPLERAEIVPVTAEQETAVEEPTANEEPIEAEPEKDPSHFELVTEAFTREQHFDIDIDTDAREPITDSYPAPETDVPAAETATIAEPETASESETTETVASDTSVIEEASTSGSSTETRDPATAESTTRSFTSWLKSGSVHVSSVPPSEEKPEVPEPVVPEKKRFDELIDTFIKEEPSITRSKTEFFSPSRKAKESLDEEAVPVSETLAKIYAAQGNYPKAIHVYHQLLLSFPEKKSLFAVQIEILKKKITP